MTVSQVSLAEFCGVSELPTLNPAVIAQQNADAHWLVQDAQGQVLARCSVWWRETPVYPAQRLGLVGHYFAQSQYDSEQLLNAAEKQLAEHGCTLAIGPLDGNTWRSYRFVTERGSEPPFFLEPNQPAQWVDYFVERGYSPLAEYYSTLNTHLLHNELALATLAQRLTQRDISVRNFRMDDFDNELQRIYDVSVASFSKNFLYTPISQQEFLFSYSQLRAYCIPDLIFLAEQDGYPIGFLFALPDWLQLRQGQAIDTVIIKTLAVRPEWQMSGLGSLLLARSEKTFHRFGYRRSIHALMHQDNASRKMSGHTQSAFLRRYALFAKAL
ncbi:MAG TPA: GNAT family N-acetyltransferase [Anaerolineales bacterium]|nr:GNAT family N-acetyltransferase [Anaerolineales bacterium]